MFGSYNVYIRSIRIRVTQYNIISSPLYYFIPSSAACVTNCRENCGPDRDPRVRHDCRPAAYVCAILRSVCIISSVGTVSRAFSRRIAVRTALWYSVSILYDAYIYTYQRPGVMDRDARTAEADKRRGARVHIHVRIRVVCYLYLYRGKDTSLVRRLLFTSTS